MNVSAYLSFFYIYAVFLFCLFCIVAWSILCSCSYSPDDQTRRLWSPNSSTLVAKLVEFVKMFSKNAVGVLSKRCYRSA